MPRSLLLSRSSTGSQLLSMLVMTIKTLNKLGARYLKSHLLQNEPVWSQRSLGNCRLWVPLLTEARLVSTRERDFFSGDGITVKCPPQDGLPGSFLPLLLRRHIKTELHVGALFLNINSLIFCGKALLFFTLSAANSTTEGVTEILFAGFLLHHCVIYV